MEFHKFICCFLKKVGVSSVCICCDDSSEVFHQLNLAKVENGFSFDDVTNGMFSPNSEIYFDYDLNTAQNFEQGNRGMYDDLYWIIIPNSYVYAIISKECTDDIGEFCDYVDSINRKRKTK